MNKNNIPAAVINRLPKYLRYLENLKDDGIERISSKDLSIRMDASASQIRQDLNKFGGFGQQGYGYNVEFLYQEIKKILGLNVESKLIVVGAGNLGQALAKHPYFGNRGFKVAALFDKNVDTIGKTVRDIPIFDINYLKEYSENNNVDIAVLTVPTSAAIETAKQIQSCKIKAIWNFTHLDLKLDKDIIIENVYLTDSLMTLSFKLKNLHN